MRSRDAQNRHSHFYNEAYLLPWWLKHHREIFDHGVLIDYASTDSSADICRDLVPGWEVVQSENAHFSAILCDFEVMKHEQRFASDWKIALNTTEFLMAPELSNFEQYVLKNNFTGLRMPGAIMIDTEPGEVPDPERPLVQQKHAGVWEKAFNYNSARIPEGLTFPTRKPAVSSLPHRRLSSRAVARRIPRRCVSALAGPRCHLVVRIQPLEPRSSESTKALDRPAPR